MKKTLALNSYNIISFESRKSEAMAQLILKQGGNVISAPSMQEIPLDNNPDVFHFAEKLFAGEVDVMIYLTGAGARTLIQTMQKKYDLEKIIKALSIPISVARGPKPVKVLKEMKIPIAVQVSEPNTWREVIQELGDYKESGSLEGKVVAIQEYGVTNEDLVNGLKRRGASVLQVPVYRWALPDDIKPLKQGISQIINRQVDIAMFSSANQIHNLMRVAAEEGREDDVKSALQNTVVASIGPMCSQAIESHGVTVDIEPKHSTMGAFIVDLGQKAKEAIALKQQQILDSEKANALTVESPILQRNETFDAAALHDSVFMKALRLEPTDHTPVWLMRQAGRYMKEYRDIRKKMPFLEFCKRPDRVTEITVKAQEMLNADAAIIFSDILVVVECLGLDLEYSRNEGPAIQVTLDEGKTIDDLNGENIEEQLSYVYEGIRLTRRALKPNIPLIGFAGAPFTLASYMIEGGTSKTFQRTKAFMYADEKRWNVLMETLSRCLIRHLKAQVDAGTQVVQLFDSWVGCLGPEDYKRYVKPFSTKIIQSIMPHTPVIHFGTQTATLLEDMSEAGSTAMGADFRIPLDDAWDKVGHDKAIQGNLDPMVLYGERNFIKERIHHIMNQAAGRPGHIFNLGHGILPDTPVDNAKFLVDCVHSFKLRR